MPFPIIIRSRVHHLRWKIFAKWERALDQGTTGPTWLQIPWVAEMVREAILHRHPHEYELICFCIMPNHVHQVIIHIQEKIPVYRILGNLKSYTGLKANRFLNRSGSFWQSESFDHVVRQGKLYKTISYVLNNPVAANLVADWRAWPYSWLNPRFGGFG